MELPSLYSLKIVVLLILLSLSIFSCQKREYSNPYDENVDPLSWAPYDLKIEEISITEKLITWKCEEEDIEGFWLDRKVGNNDWHTNYKEVGNGTFEIIDNIVPDPDLVYYYRLQAYAGDLFSPSLEINESFEINPVSDLQIEMISMQEIKLSWTDNTEGEEGFKIDRKVGNGSWEVGFAEVGENISDYIDISDFTSEEIIYYRVYAYYDQYSSAYVETDININCKVGFTDPRNGEYYEVTLIGNQCWMAENLNYETGNSWCYDNNVSNCDTYGRLYDWSTALDACPPGWNLPNDDEWCTLTTYIDSTVHCDATGWSGTDAGYKMKSTSGWYSNGNGSDAYGFAALPGGYRGTSGSFGCLSEDGHWWSSMEGGSTNAWYLGLGYYNDGVYSGSYGKDNGFSVRCVRD